MRAQPTYQSVAMFGDLPTQLDELGREVGLLRDVTRCPPITRVGIVIDQRRAFSGELRKLTHLRELAQLLVDATLAASHPRFGAVVHGRQYQAMRAVTMPPGPTATAVGTSAMPYLRASSGRRDTSTVKTSRPAATSSRSRV